MEKIFKRLLLAALALYVTSFFLPWFTWKHYTQDQAQAISWYGAGGLETHLQIVFSYSFLVIFIVAYVGLFFFQRWARTLYFSAIVLSYVYSLFAGVVVSIPIESIFWGAYATLEGALIAILLFTSIATHFNHPHNK